jgi:uncharacterized protein YjdB
VIIAAKCEDKIPLGIENVGPHAPSSPGPHGPTGSGPGRLTGGGGADSVASIAIAPSSLALTVGDSAQVVAAAADANGKGVTGITFTWASSDTRIVRVRVDATTSEVAHVTGLAVGSATVSVKAGPVTANALVAVTRRP